MPSSAEPLRLKTPLRRVSLHAAEIDSAAREQAVEAARKAAYQQGFDDASAFHTQQLGEQRAEVIQLIEQTLQGISTEHAEVPRQLAAMLPGLAVEVARRVLCGLDPDRERVARAAAEVLSEMAPGTRDIEVALHPAELALLGRYDEQFQERYPGLRFTADTTLAVGDCRMRSSYGIVDARLSTKLETLARSLA